ncbi:MAG: acyltransferase family protein [Muribaculaceae bacterium]
MKQRIEYFDLLKGMAIFLVVMGHVITMCIRGIDAAFLFKLIGQVHMPVFFFISGYFTYKDSFAPPALKKRFIQLIVPFFVVSALWIWYFPHSSLGSPMSSTLTGLYCSFWKDGYWFTLCLFMLFLIYWPLSAVLRRCSRLWQQLVAVVVTYAVLLFVASLWSSEADNFDIAGLGLLSWFFPIFIFGVFAKKYSTVWLKVTSSGTWLTVAAILFPLALFTLVYPWDLPYIPEWTRIISRPLLHVSVVVIAVTAVSPWSSREFAPVARAESRPSIVARFFKYLGTESLSIYLLHYFFLFPLTPLQEPLKAMGLPFVPLTAIAALVALCIVVVTLFVAHIISFSPLLSLLLLGKQAKK